MTQIAIIGAGIGGLTLARSLSESSIDVTLYERAPELRAAGAGILIQINAMLALDVLGAGDAVRGYGAAIGEVALRSRAGDVLHSVDLGSLEERFGTLGYALHRRDLVRALSDDVDLTVEFAKTLERITEARGKQVMHFRDGTTATADLVIGSDGLHSATRRAVLGDQPMRYSGYTAWRGVAEIDDVGVGMGEFWGGDLRYGCLPIGGGMLNWFAVSVEPAGGEDSADPRRDLIELFDGWYDPILETLERTPPEHIIRNDIFDRPPSKTWGKGAVTLLGDAAHPMTPNLGQGGGQAVEDAVVLGHLIKRDGPTATTLRAYELARRRRANMFVRRSYSYGQLAHWRGAVTSFGRDLMIRAMPRALALRQFESLYSFTLP